MLVLCTLVVPLQTMIFLEKLANEVGYQKP